MKNIKIIAALLALLLSLSAVLASCGGNDDDAKETEDTSDATESVGTGETNKNDTLVEERVEVKAWGIMNKDWALAKSTAIKSYAEVIYKGTYSDPQNGFIVSVENSQDNTKRVTYVYNVNTDKELVKLEDSYKEETTGTGYQVTTIYNYVNNYVDIISSDYFAVLTVTRASNSSRQTNTLQPKKSYTSGNFDANIYAFKGSSDAYFAKYTLTIYKADGTVAKTVTDTELATLCENDVKNFDNATSGVYYTIIKDYQPKATTTISGTVVGDLLVSGSKVYRKGADGVYALVKDYGVSKMPDFSKVKLVGEKYYEVYGNSIIVYDKELSEEFNYTYPGHAQSPVCELLANGNLLVQYGVELDSTATEFDYRTSGSNSKKYDLVTVLVNKDGTTQLNDISFIFIDIEPSVAGLDGQKKYDAKVENLAIIVPIDKTQPIDKLESNWQLITLSSDCKEIAYVVADREQIIDFPEPINDDCFAMDVFGGGKVIYNENGEKQGKLESLDVNALIDGKFICIKNDAIYNLKGEKVYDLSANKATYSQLGSSLLITANDAGKVKYLTLVGGELKEISGELVDVSNKGYYYAVKKSIESEGKTTYKYSYFNSNGAEIGLFDNLLEVDFEGDGFIAMKEKVTGGKTYKFIFGE